MEQKLFSNQPGTGTINPINMQLFSSSNGRSGILQQEIFFFFNSSFGKSNSFRYCAFPKETILLLVEKVKAHLNSAASPRIA